MKKLSIFLLFLCLIFSPSSIEAHLAGQPPFFKINGVYSNLYPTPATSLADFNLPQDLAPEIYLVGQKLDFELDTEKLPIPKEVVEKTNFSWDFGDGQKGSGLKNSHSYSTIGSFFLTILASDTNTPEPQLIQSILINVVRDKNFKLPKSQMIINNWQTKEPLTDILEANFNQEFFFYAGNSEAEGRIIEYIWDFGDGQGGKGEVVKHTYTNNPYNVFPVLRIRTSDGFIADTFAQIKENPNASSLPNLTVNSNNSFGVPFKYFIYSAGIILLIVGGGLFFLRKKRNH